MLNRARADTKIALSVHQGADASRSELGSAKGMVMNDGDFVESHTMNQCFSF
jgi:hypothetical protein